MSTDSFVMCAACQATYPIGELCPECTPNRLKRLEKACIELLEFIRQTHPADFEEGGRGFTRSSHRAIDRALNGDECFPTSKLLYEES